MGRRALFAFAMAVATVAAALTWRLYSDPVRRVIAAAGRHRLIEARLSGGFDWAPLPRKAIGLPKTVQSAPAPRVRGERRTLASFTLGPSDADQRAGAMATLLFGDRRGAAIARFEQLAAEHPQEPQIRSDLSAARYEAGVTTGDASLIAAALADADAALELDPSLPEALFNRAVAIEYLGIRDEARKAWRRYLAIDSSSDWAAEAQERIRRIPPIPFFMVDLRVNYDRLAADPAFAHEMARARPEETRLYSETVILNDWAEAAAAGDTVAAERHLRVAREFGVELARNRGDHMVRQAVRAVETADDARRQHLIRGHKLFREGQNEFKVDRAAAAQKILARAVDELAQGGTPVWRLAALFYARSFDVLGDVAEGRRRELKLLAEAPPEFRAHRAQVLWFLGLGYQWDGDLGKALEVLGESVAIYDDLGETDYAAGVRERLAEAHDHNGNPEEAWRQRLVALRGTGRLTMPRLAMAVRDVGRAAMMRKEWPVARSFLHLAAEVAVTVGRPTIEAEVRLLQARTFAENGDLAAARAAIANARAATAKIDDAAAQQEALIDLDRSEALVAPSPEVAVSLLTRAIDFHSTRGRRVVLPELFLARGRAYRDGGQASLAAADFESGIAQFEKRRESLPKGELRWGTFDTAGELFEEAVASALARRDVATAFAYAERSRARALLETLGAATPGAVPASFTGGATLIEYFSLPDRLILFAVNRGVIRSAEARVSRTALDGEAEAFRRALAEGSPRHRQLGAALYRHIVAPVEREAVAGGTLVFIPGPHFPAVSFAALTAGDSYLVERHEIVIAPSAAVYAQLASRPRAAGSPQAALIVANATPDAAGALSGAENEAADVARLYGHSRQLLRSEATVDAYRRLAPAADVIHMGTHGLALTAGGGGGLLLHDAVLDSKTIASIPLPHTRTVVLAACDSARGPARAEGTISAARGFLAAGVPAVVATLWKIEDRSAAQFFPRLHRELARGIPAATAVREAQIESLERGEPPAQWAAVQCIGTDGG